MSLSKQQGQKPPSAIVCLLPTGSKEMMTDGRFLCLWSLHCILAGDMALSGEVLGIIVDEAIHQNTVASKLAAIRAEWDGLLLPLAEAAGFTLEEAKGLIEKVGYQKAARMMAHNALRPVPGPDELILDPEPLPKKPPSNWMLDWERANNR